MMLAFRICDRWLTFVHRSSLAGNGTDKLKVGSQLLIYKRLAS